MINITKRLGLKRPCIRALVQSESKRLPTPFPSPGILDPATAQRLDAVFEKYAPDCKEVELEAWRKRGLWHKLKDNAFYLYD